MLISIECPKCRKTLEVDPDHCSPGNLVSCPDCNAPVPSPEKKLGPGTTLGGFRIQRKLGQGAMGEVYLARQLSMDRDVALKILPPQIAIRPSLVDRFRQEVRMAAKLDHPNLVTAFEAGLDSGVYFLAMALVDGEPLDVIIHRDGALPEQASLRIIRKVASALEQAWNRYHLLHRDIKPGNIMLDRYGEPRLTDLGLAKSLDESDALTQTSMIMGTPNYMSPEQVQGLAAIDFRSDLYGLGTTLYHLITGTVPFEGSSLPDTLRKQVTDRLPDPRIRNPEITESCVDLLERMLAKDREKRHSTYEDLIADIGRVLDGKASRAQPLDAGQSTLMRAGVVPDARPKKKISMSHSRVERLLKARIDQRLHPQEGRKSRLPAVVAMVVVTLLVAGGTRLLIRGRTHEPAPARQPAKPVLPDVETARPGDNDSGTPQRDDAHTQVVSAVATPSLAEENSPVSAVVPVTVGPDREAAPRNDSDEIADANDERQRLLAGIADSLLAGDLSAARRALATADRNPVMAGWGEEWTSIRHDADQAIDMPTTVMEAYRNHLGKQTTVYLTSGARKLRIDSVESGRVRGTEQIVVDGRVAGSSVRDFDYTELSLREKMIRLGQEPNPERDIIRGLLVCTHDEPQNAVPYFRRSGTRLGDILMERVRQAETAQQTVAQDRRKRREESAAIEGYENLLRMLGIRFSGEPPEVLARFVRLKRLRESQIEMIQRNLASFSAAHRDTECAATHAEVLHALGELVPDMPLYVDRATVDQAIDRIQALHQGYTIKIAIDHADDTLSVDLSGNALLQDISPLEGLPIRSLNLMGSGVRDLTPLKGMPLRKLDLGECGQVKNIAPLEGMQLVWLSVGGCARDLELKPIEGMPLQYLDIRGMYDLTSLNPLSGMPLHTLRMPECSLVADVSAIRGAPLKHFEATNCSSLTDLGPLRGMPLVTVIVDLCLALTDISPLADCPLQHLNIKGSGVTDLSPLFKLEKLEVIR